MNWIALQLAQIIVPGGEGLQAQSCRTMPVDDAVIRDRLRKLLDIVDMATTTGRRKAGHLHR